MSQLINVKNELKKSKMKCTALIMILMSLLTAVSCDDIFEEDITDDEIFLLAPSAGVTIQPDSAITFVWDFIEGASEYQIQVAEPSFDSARLLLLDSFTTNNQIDFALPPGTYEWAVRGLNNGYSTAFFINDFIVDDTTTVIPAISSEIQPLTPNTEVKSGLIFFWWEDLENADEYRLQVATPDFDSPTELFYDTIVDKTGIRLSLEAGKYSWRVKGINEVSESDFKELSFTVVDESDGGSGRSSGAFNLKATDQKSSEYFTDPVQEPTLEKTNSMKKSIEKDLYNEE